MVMRPNDTQSKGKHKAEKTAALMKQAEKELGLIDLWRYLNPHDRKYTFYSEAHKGYSRLDCLFIFKEDITRIEKCEIKAITYQTMLQLR